MEKHDDVQKRSARTSPMLWVGLGLTLAMLLLALLMAVLKLKNAAQGSQGLPVLGTVSNFTLTNQEGRTITLGDLQGRVWVADIIFTRCAGPCLRMSRQMSLLQDALPAGSNTRLVSLTTDPEFDKPDVLKTYAARFDADPVRWLFLTGSKQEIFNLATASLKLTGMEKQPAERQDPNDLFIHSTIFVVVDKKARLRGVFETEGEGIDTEARRKEIVDVIKRLGAEQ